jgi:phage shock protein PspC (stress-responsive transcriptional regulator)
LSAANTAPEQAYKARKRRLLMTAAVSCAVLFGLTFMVGALELQFKWPEWAMRTFFGFIAVGALATLFLCLYIVFMMVLHTREEE